MTSSRTARLGDVIQIIKGSKAEDVVSFSVSGSNPYLQIDHLRGKRPDEYTTDKGGAIATPEDVVIAWDGANAGTVGFGLSGFIGSTLALLRSSEEIHAAYLGYFLRSRFDYLRAQTTGATIPHLSRESLENLELPLPPLAEQRHIAAILCAADDERRRRRYTQSLSDGLLGEVFVRMFGDPATNPMGWEVASIEEVLAIRPQNGLYVPAEDYVGLDDPDGIEMVHMSDLFYDIVQRGQLKRVRSNIKNLSQYLLTESDLLIARRSLNFEGAAKPCLIPNSPEPLVFESSMIRLRPNASKVLPIYLFYYLSNRAARETHVYKYITVSTISGISQDSLTRIKAVVPPIEVQLHFAAIVAEHERVRRQQQESARQSDHLFDTLLHRAFAGEL